MKHYIPLISIVCGFLTIVVQSNLLLACGVGFMCLGFHLFAFRWIKPL
jgi:hypothetical protein